MIRKALLKCLIFQILFTNLLSQDKMDLNLGVYVDQVFKSDLEKNDHNYQPREVGLILFGPVNHLFEATVSIAAHEEDGEFKLELHEAWVASSSLLKNFEFKAGQYFLGIGILNKTHRHEWSFISPPKFFEELFDEKGVRDSGLEVTYRIPGKLNLSILGGLASGRTFGEKESSSNGKQPNLPTNYLRIGYFFEAFEWNGFDMGLNYLNRIDGEGNQSLFLGLDFIGEKKSESILKHLIHNEIWFNQTSLEDDSKNRIRIGTYLYYQYGINKNWAIGPRLDYLSELTRENDFGESVSHFNIRGILSLTYGPTEFMRFKLDYSYGFEKEGGKNLNKTNMIEFQVLFLIGKHPTH